MTIGYIILIVGGILTAIAYVPYIWATLVGSAKPAKVTWIIWASLDIITMIGMYVQDALNVQIVICSVGATIIALLALKYGTPSWDWLDVFCIVGAVMGLGIWWAFGEPNLGIMMSLGIIFIGSFPTFASAWNHPEKENRASWTIYCAADICMVSIIPKLTLQDASQPITFLLIGFIMMYLLWFHKPPVASPPTEQPKTA